MPGGIRGPQFAALRAEALEFAGPGGGYTAYLDMARRLDEAHAAVAGETLAAAIELAEAQSIREAERRAERAAAAVLRRSSELRLAVEALSRHPHLAADPDSDAGPGMGSAELGHRLRIAMGLASRAPTAYEAMLPAVGDLAHAIGLRP
jgi:hypothetical protein